MSEASAQPPSAGEGGSPRPAPGGQAPMAKAYQPAEVEPAVYARWLAADVFAPDGAGSRARHTAEPFVVIMPPPNVTGALHLGHAARSATEDLMVRRARMQQRPTLWLPGVDHASIAAQWVLRRVLADEGTTPEELGPGALPGAHVALHGRDAPGHHGPAAPPGHLGRLGPRALHHGRALGAGRARRLQATLRGRPGLPRPEARQLVPGLRHQRLRPGGHRHARSRAGCGPSATTCCPRARRPARARAATRPSPWRPRARRPSSATRPWRSTRRTRATPRSSAARCASPSSIATCPSSPTPSWSATSAPAP